MEPTITIPLSMLSGVKELSTQGIIDALQINQTLVQENAGLQGRIVAHRELLKSVAGELDSILNADHNPMQRAQALRTFAAELKGKIQ